LQDDRRPWDVKEPNSDESAAMLVMKTFMPATIDRMGGKSIDDDIPTRGSIYQRQTEQNGQLPLRTSRTQIFHIEILAALCASE